MHLFLKDLVVFEVLIEEEYPQIKEQREVFLEGLDENSGPYYIVYSDFYPGEKLRFAMGVSQPLDESETVICIDRNIEYRVFPFKTIEELDRLWMKISQEQAFSHERAYLIDYELHHGDGAGELHLSVLDD